MLKGEGSGKATRLGSDRSAGRGSSAQGSRGASFSKGKEDRATAKSSDKEKKEKKFKGFDSPVVFVVALIGMLVPAIIAFILQNEIAVPLFVAVLKIDWIKPILFLLIAVEFFFRVVRCQGLEKFGMSLFWLLVCACLWLRTWPQVPVLSVLMMVPAAALVTHRLGKKPWKNWIWIGHAGSCSVIIVVLYWLTVNVFLYDAPASFPLLSPVQKGCPKIDRTDSNPIGFAYTTVASNCREQAVKLNLATEKEAEKLVPKSIGARKGCCVFRNFTTGLLFSDGSCPSPEVNMHYVCKTEILPRISTESFTTLRVELVSQVFKDGDPSCDYGLDLLLNKQSDIEKNACRMIDEWWALYTAAPWFLVMTYFLMACIAYLRGHYMKAVKDARKREKDRAIESERIREEERRAANPNLPQPDEQTKKEDPFGDVNEMTMTAKGVMIGIFTLLLAMFFCVQMLDSFQSDSFFGKYFIQVLSLTVVVGVIWALREFDLYYFAGSAAGEISGLTQQAAGMLPFLLSIQWVQAALSFFLWPLYLLLGAVSWLWQKCLDCCKCSNSDMKTKTFSPLFEFITAYISLNWHIPFILDKFWLIALVMLFVVAGSELTKVALSWLDQAIRLLPLTTVMVLFCLFGAFMFLNPAAPGFVVYFFAGIVVTKRAITAQDGEEPWSFTQGILLGITVALAIKLIASWMQMLLGSCFGWSAKIRYTVGLHTPLIKAIEVILNDEKFTLNKFGVINGGPDWPTSVFCGMIGLPAYKVLFWTLPTITIVAPAVLSGATVGATQEPYKTLNSMSFLLAMLFQITYGFLAARAVAAITDKYKDKLAEIRPDHQDLIEIDEKQALRTSLLETRTAWNCLGRWSKLWIVLSGLLSVTLTTFMMYRRILCVRVFAMGADYTLPLEEGGLNGDFRNILLTPGAFVVMSLPFAGIFNMFFWFSIRYKIDAVVKEELEGDGGIQLVSRPSEPSHDPVTPKSVLVDKPFTPLMDK